MLTDMSADQKNNLCNGALHKSIERKRKNAPQQHRHSHRPTGMPFK
jgi:hypothetical protein